MNNIYITGWKIKEWINEQFRKYFESERARKVGESIVIVDFEW